MGLIQPLLEFLDRNLSRFSPPVRDIIGVGVLLILVIYVLNGLIGSTYIRGQLFVNELGSRSHAAQWRVSLGDYEAVTNEKGWWTLPLPGNGIPGQIRLEVEDSGKDVNGQTRKSVQMGEIHAYGPWPFWNTIKPMNNLVLDVYPEKPVGQRLEITATDFLQVRSVYAQSNVPAKTPQRARIDKPPCAPSINRVKVDQFPGFFRSSGRVYFRMFLDGKGVADQALLYGPGIKWASSQFPVRSDKELWLPVRTGSDDRYGGLFADLTDVADCSFDSAGKIQVRSNGRITLVMFGDQGNILNSFDLTTALAAPNQEIALAGDPKGKASISVEVTAQGLRITQLSLTGHVISWKVTGAASTVTIQGMDKQSTEEVADTRATEGTYNISGDREFVGYALQVRDANGNIAQEKQITVK